MGSPLKDLQSSTCSVTTQIQRLTTYTRANCPWGTAEVHFTPTADQWGPTNTRGVNATGGTATMAHSMVERPWPSIGCFFIVGIEIDCCFVEDVTAAVPQPALQLGTTDSQGV